MPQRRNNAGPPPVMTWPKASLVLVIAGIFDALRIFFEMFWFFGPALAAVATNAAAGGGTFGKAAAVMFGVIMAMAVGFAGFLVIGLLIIMTNQRLFKVSATGSLWFVGGFGLSEIPFLGTIPAFSIVPWKLYKTQIRIEEEQLKKYLEEQDRVYYKHALETP